MGKEFNITPQEVPHVSTKYRTICTPIPHPDSLSVLERSRKFEPVSMSGMPPIVWEKAEDIFVYDKHGNRWLDWSSGVLVTNCGHGVPEVRQAIIDQVNSGLLHNYVFPGEERVAVACPLEKGVSTEYGFGSDGVCDQAFTRSWYQGGRAGKNRHHRL